MAVRVVSFTLKAKQQLIRPWLFSCKVAGGDYTAAPFPKGTCTGLTCRNQADQEVKFELVTRNPDPVIMARNNRPWGNYCWFSPGPDRTTMERQPER